jgi:hypothetical protein
LDCYGNSWGTFDVIAYLGMDTLSLRIGKMTFRGQLFCRTIAERSDCHFEKMTLGDFGKSSNMTKMSLWFEGFFGISPPFLCGEQAVCKTALLRSKV